MKKFTQKTFILFLFSLSIGTLLFFSCTGNGGANAVQAPTKDAPIAATAAQQSMYRATFATEISKDSVWVTAFEKAFASAFGADSLKKFLDRNTLPHLAISENQTVSGTERGEFVINTGNTLTVSGIVYGSISIKKNATLRNQGVIYGTIENAGGFFEDTGFHQGIFIRR